MLKRIFRRVKRRVFGLFSRLVGGGRAAVRVQPVPPLHPDIDISERSYIARGPDPADPTRGGPQVSIFETIRQYQAEQRRTLRNPRKAIR